MIIEERGPMKHSSISTRKSLYQLGLFALFLLCGFLVFVLGLYYPVGFPKNLRLVYKIALSASFLAAVPLVHRSKHLRQYRQVFLAFFIASTALVFDHYHDELGSLVLGGEETGALWYTIVVVFSTSVIVITIVALTKISGGSMASIYLKKGNLRLGLIIGISTFLAMSILGILWAQSQNIGMDRITPIIPYVLVFGLTNGLREELLLRGLFLRKHEALLGPTLSIVLTALIFTAAHLGVTYETGNLVVFFSGVFVIGLISAFLMRKLDSLLAPVLFHAGCDVILFTALFAAS